VVANAEQVEGKENSRFVVTSLSGEQWGNFTAGAATWRTGIIAKSRAFPVVVSETK
jgi:hypothetical protein